MRRIKHQAVITYVTYDKTYLLTCAFIYLLIFKISSNLFVSNIFNNSTAYYQDDKTKKMRERNRKIIFHRTDKFCMKRLVSCNLKYVIYNKK